MRSWWNVFVVWPFVLASCGCWLVAANELQSAQFEAVTQGEINSTHFDNRHRYGYWFKINGQIYTGHEAGEVGDLSIGSKVTVHYDVRDPKQNAIGESLSANVPTEGAIAIGLLVLSAGLVIGVAVVVQHNRRVARVQPTIYP